MNNDFYPDKVNIFFISQLLSSYLLQGNLHLCGTRHRIYRSLGIVLQVEAQKRSNKPLVHSNFYFWYFFSEISSLASKCISEFVL